MNQKVEALQKNPKLEAAQDFYRLRRDGIGFIEQLGSDRWTDYNTHDPGITTLESLCYATTDLAYRISWDIKDILAPEIAASDPAQPYPNQAFFTAREILTVNPTTSDDLRRLLIDLPGVRNAWVEPQPCACDTRYYAWCDRISDELVLSYESPLEGDPAPKAIWPQGLYESLLELEADPDFGDLNDRKIEQRSVFHDSTGAHSTLMELRFPDISQSNRNQWQVFLDSDSVFAHEDHFKLHLIRFGATKDYDVLTDASLNEAGKNAYLHNHWRTVFYVSFEIAIVATGQMILIENASLHLFSDPIGKMATTVSSLRTLLEEKDSGGFIQRYRKKTKQALSTVATAKETLFAHRNLDEDYCTVKVVGIEEIAVCADVEVKADADIERIQAYIWFEIEQYFNPAIPFYTLQELYEKGEPVEEIFNGPALESGFIRSEDLQAASLKSILRVSDIVNRLMKIDGIIAVSHLLLTKYDTEGNAVKGSVDPRWVDGNPVFDSSKTSAAWLMFISSRHQPRLYLNLSQFLFHKNGLPFQARMDEASDTLNELRGAADRPKDDHANNDLNIPKGNFRNPEDYYPVQYGFPQNYGVGPSGLPSNASALRRAQAKQFKAYLMIFEQLLGNALAQLAHTADLFSLDSTIQHSYFVRTFSEVLIQGFDEIKQAEMSTNALQEMAETLSEFHERRNRFLDHLLARFGEQFGEYAMLLTNAAGKQVAQGKLIEDKIMFLNRYPVISHNRARAFDYTRNPCSQENYAGIKKRIALLLGYPDLNFSFHMTSHAGGKYHFDFSLLDRNAKQWLLGKLKLQASGESEAKQLAYQAIVEQMSDSDSYDIDAKGDKFRLELIEGAGIAKAECPTLFTTRAIAQEMQEELLRWSANERMMVVEHLLLRPKFPGDALYPACSSGKCGVCGEEDPYSFRLTFVMPSWSTQYTENLELRRFSERTIQQETPSHLLAKICWVGNDGYINNDCDEIFSKLADPLVSKGLKGNNQAPTEQEACACAHNLFQASAVVFDDWFKDKMLDYIHPNSLTLQLGSLFSTKLKPIDFSSVIILSPPLWDDLLAILLKHFIFVASNGRQFERFEAVWCEWLKENSKFDWTEERLQESLRAILAANLLIFPVRESDLCACADAILNRFGMQFYLWMDSNLKAGRTLRQFTSFTPDDIVPCAHLSFKPGVVQSITTLLKERYKQYEVVSYRLWIVVDLLSKLRNTYPSATLHDCDDGSDLNPVRLGNTALGNYPLRSALS